MKRLLMLAAALAFAAPAWASEADEAVVLDDVQLDEIVAAGKNPHGGGRSVSCRGNCNVSPVTVVQETNSFIGQTANRNVAAASPITQTAVNISPNVAVFSVDIRQRNGIVRGTRGVPAS